MTVNYSTSHILAKATELRAADIDRLNEILAEAGLGRPLRHPAAGAPAADESGLAGSSQGDLARLFAQAGLAAAQVTTLGVRVRHATFEQWWEPFTFGVGPAGAYITSLPPEQRTALRERCRRLLPGGQVEISALAWAARCRT